MTTAPQLERPPRAITRKCRSRQIYLTVTNRHLSAAFADGGKLWPSLYRMRNRGFISPPRRSRPKTAISPTGIRSGVRGFVNPAPAPPTTLQPVDPLSAPLRVALITPAEASGYRRLVRDVTSSPKMPNLQILTSCLPSGL